MDLQCDQCKKEIEQQTPANEAAGNKTVSKVTAWYCQGCSQLYCTECIVHHEPGELLGSPRCPFCESVKVNIATGKDIETWRYFRKKTGHSNKGCMVFLGITGLIVAFIMII